MKTTSDHSTVTIMQIPIATGIGGLIARLFQPAVATQVQNGSQSSTTKASAALDVSTLGQSSTTSSSAGRDYSRMTPREMQGIAQSLYESGKIDVTQLFMLQNAGMPLGKAGANGEFVPLTAAERASFQDKPVNYLKISQDAITNLEQSGKASDPKSGYAQWTGILSALKQSTSGVDVRA